MKDGRSMNHIFSPWRMKYVMKPKERTNGCVFCNVLRMDDGPENLVLYRGKHSFVILNQFPYTSGHTMVVPYAHQPSFENLTQSTLYEIMDLMSFTTRVIREVYQPEGFNIGVNIGVAAGAGIAPHVHFHIVPRWVGDTNFTTTLAETRVLPEDLCDTYQKLKATWDKQFHTF